MKLLTTTQIAACLSIARITVQKWCERGLFPHARKIGRDWLIPESDFLKFKLPKIGYPKGRPRK